MKKQLQLWWGIWHKSDRIICPQWH